MSTETLFRYEGFAFVKQARALHIVNCQLVVERALIPSGERLLPGQIEWGGSFLLPKLLAFDEAVLELPDQGSYQIAISGSRPVPGVEPSYRYEFVGLGVPPPEYEQL